VAAVGSAGGVGMKRTGGCGKGARLNRSSLLDGGAAGVGAVPRRRPSVPTANARREPARRHEQETRGGGAVLIRLYPPCIGEYLEGLLG
jgi:hypothetical protein